MFETSSGPVRYRLGYAVRERAAHLGLKRVTQLFGGGITALAGAMRPSEPRAHAKPVSLELH